MVDFTVVIPTYNGEHRLPLVLEKLRSQFNTEDFTWEICVVDNNSTDQTSQAVHQCQADSPIPIRYIVETRQGAGFARQRAMYETHSPLVGFLDDDNIPDGYWVAAAYQFAQEHPSAGAYASRIDGDFEGEIPPNFDRLLPFFALTQRGSAPRLYDPKQKILPPSAGLVLRKQAWLDPVPDHLILGGRANGNMLTGEDIEMLSSDSGQWLAARNRRAATAEPKAESARPTRQRRSALTASEKKDLQSMEDMILDAEADVEACQRSLNEIEESSDHVEVQQRWEALEEARRSVEALYARWEELEAKARSTD